MKDPVARGVFAGDEGEAPGRREKQQAPPDCATNFEMNESLDEFSNQDQSCADWRVESSIACGGNKLWRESLRLDSQMGRRLRKMGRGTDAGADDATRRKLWRD